ncbi:MAG: hydrogenase nickel incorporation protein HypB [bacterium]
MEIIDLTEGEVVDVELQDDLFAKNRELALANRKVLDKNNIFSFDIMGSVGSGKTSLIENMTQMLKRKYKIGVIAGDVTTEIDAQRIEDKGAEVVQIHTQGGCHLDSHIVGIALNKLSLSNIDILFIENVGNLICPAEFPVGAHKRLVVISVTEGPYMVVKHPFMFREADIVAINKIDLAVSMKVDPDQLSRDLLDIKKDIKVFKISCITGEGVGDIIKCMNFQ